MRSSARIDRIGIAYTYVYVWVKAAGRHQDELQGFNRDGSSGYPTSRICRIARSCSRSCRYSNGANN